MDLHIDGMEVLQWAKKKKKKKQHKRKRAAFKAQWVKLPRRWVEALCQSKSVNTYRLAHAILFEAFRQEQGGGEIVLSTITTGLDRATKMRAVQELVRFKLIKIKQDGHGAARVVSLL